MSRIFGPVASRRLGRSLGIDVVPYKICSFDCIYCECGKTTDLTCSRSEFFPIGEIIGEFSERIASISEKPDVITFSGAGEPTLYSRLGELISEVKRISSLPVAVLTNTSLFGREDVRDELMNADIILPSLDSATEESFLRINRPHPGCSLESIISGLEIFLSRFTGRVNIEILLIEGINSGEDDLKALKAVLDRVRYDSIQLNTAVRPGTLDEVRPMARNQLEKIMDFFGSRCEIVAETPARALHEEAVSEHQILKIVERRPSSAMDLHLALGYPIQELVKHLAVMTAKGQVSVSRKEGLTFYTATDRSSS
ncbi:MAG: radical SAM protein [Candidatus Krumholzibacteriota bacterium]|nr:radical SAM protein [Candidatus Krumholzibacteriota bacterium]